MNKKKMNNLILEYVDVLNRKMSSEIFDPFDATNLNNPIKDCKGLDMTKTEMFYGLFSQNESKNITSGGKYKNYILKKSNIREIENAFVNGISSFLPKMNIEKIPSTKNPDISFSLTDSKSLNFINKYFSLVPDILFNPKQYFSKVDCFSVMDLTLFNIKLFSLFPFLHLSSSLISSFGTLIASLSFSYHEKSIEITENCKSLLSKSAKDIMVKTSQRFFLNNIYFYIFSMSKNVLKSEAQRFSLSHCIFTYLFTIF
jgi:hypothetical protein